MSAVAYTSRERKLSVPFVLLILSILALLVSLMGLARTSALASERMADLQVAWEAVQDGSVEGSELVATDRLMGRLRMPVPAMRNAAYWSLGLAFLSLLLFCWLLVSSRRSVEQEESRRGIEDSHEQAAVLRLMDEIAPLASGDLRVRATVGNNMTGSLAEAFNYSISELRWLVGTMGHTSEQINAAILRSRESAESVSMACTEQSAETLRSSNHLSALGGAMAEISSDAAETATTAQAAVAQAELGAESLAITLNRLFSIRNEADVTTRLMHRLVENVAAINERVGVIREVARRTDLLALNTTIRASAGSRASSPGDAAADLGRLSDEVAQLAEVLGRTTRDIDTLTSTIAQDASDTVQSMEFTSVELAAGVSQTEKATTSLQAIRQDADTLRQRASTLAQRTTAQTALVRTLSENMDVINRITRQTDDAVTGNVDSLSELEELASELRQSLADFQLPPRPAAESGAGEEGSVVKASQARRAAERAAIHG
ncbi:methyl-accepting chemotaxis protein [Granulosicoccus sp. 3-233]|uniref:methyl-accepting chemotaxis protein n=1 Tax=Granulosicoccus sp. 3-233 TaxID=3417969 RepID=UPI003D353A1A